MGYRVASLLLRLGQRVTVVTEPTREEWVRNVTEQGAVIAYGDARDERILAEAGLASATALVACTGEDLSNVEIVLDVLKLQPHVPVVARLADPNLAHQLEATFGVRRAVGMPALAAPLFAAAVMGEQVVASFTLDGALYVVGRIDVAPDSPLCGFSLLELQERFRLFPLTHASPDAESDNVFLHRRIQPGDHLVLISRQEDWEAVAASPRPVPVKAAARGKWHPEQWLGALPPLSGAKEIWRHTPVSLRLVLSALLAVTVSSVFIFAVGLRLSLVDALYYVVTTVTTVGYGDITPLKGPLLVKLFACLLMLVGPAAVAVMYAIITDYVVTARLQQLLGRRRIPQRGHVVVVGLGNIGFGIVNELRKAGCPVVAVERNPERDFVAAVRAQGAVVIGDARMPDTLVKAAVGNARALIAATSDDATNLSIGLATKQINGEVRTVLRLFDADFAHKVQSTLGIEAAMSASKLAAPTFAAAALYPGVHGALVVDDDLFVVRTQVAGDEWAGLRPAEIRHRDGTLVLLRRTGPDKPFQPAGDEALAGDEEVLCVARHLLGPATSMG